MADGVPYTSDPAVTVATDYCGSAGHVELIKLAVSTDGDATPIPGDSTYGLAVDVKRLTGSLSVSGAVSITGLSAVSLIGTGIVYSIPLNTSVQQVSGNVNVLNTVTTTRVGTGANMSYQGTSPWVTSSVGTGAVLAYQAGTVAISGNVNILTEKGADNFVCGQTTVTSGGVLIAASRATRRGITIINHGLTDIYLGGAGVSTTTGLKLKGLDGTSVYMSITGAVTGIVASSSTGQTISYMEIYD